MKKFEKLNSELHLNSTYYPIIVLSPKTMNFPFRTNGKLIVSDVSITKHFGGGGG